VPSGEDIAIRLTHKDIKQFRMILAEALHVDFAGLIMIFANVKVNILSSFLHPYQPR
jgi:hypothetical protein